MDDRDRVALRGVAMATLNAIRQPLKCVEDCIVDPTIMPLVLVGAEHEGRRAMGRLAAALRDLKRQHPTHSRIVRLATRAHDRADQALDAALAAIPTSERYDREQWELTALRVAQSLKGAERAARAILVEIDGPSAFRRTA